MWIMNAKSESGDDYLTCAKWDHGPSREEIDKVRMNLEGQDWEDVSYEEYNPKDTFQAKIDDKIYRCYITWWEIVEV